MKSGFAVEKGKRCLILLVCMHLSVLDVCQIDWFCLLVGILPLLILHYLEV